MSGCGKVGADFRGGGGGRGAVYRSEMENGTPADENTHIEPNRTGAEPEQDQSRTRTGPEQPVHLAVCETKLAGSRFLSSMKAAAELISCRMRGVIQIFHDFIIFYVGGKISV